MGAVIGGVHYYARAMIGLGRQGCIRERAYLSLRRESLWAQRTKNNPLTCDGECYFDGSAR